MLRAARLLMSCCYGCHVNAVVMSEELSKNVTPIRSW
jgi:hypothetical protein